MSITISDLSYRYPNQNNLFDHLHLSVETQGKIAVVGKNGAGKSTLLRLISGQLQPVEGTILTSSEPYYIPQHTGMLNQTVAEALAIHNKLKALEAILKGSLSQADYDTLADDWAIEAKYSAALSYWQLPHISPDSPIDDLSGGEKTKVLLAGVSIHNPEIILLDEPSNHLDETGRELLYRFIRQSTATVLVVSHDLTLLEQLETTCELSKQGIRIYGGNYSFYKEQKEIEENALDESIRNEEKSLRLARKKAQEVKQRQEKRLMQGEKRKFEVPRIFRKTLTDSSENTASRLKGKHDEIISSGQRKLAGLRQQKETAKDVKIDFDNASLHAGKTLVEATRINHAYPQGEVLWKEPLDFTLYSNDRIHVRGKNGSGKTTFIRLLTGELTPAAGQIRRAEFSWIYLDQNYTITRADRSIEELADAYNVRNLPEHEVKLRLNRFLFPASSWNKRCEELSGGEKMRLYLCCLMISNQTPDLMILDEPTNNLDIPNLQILAHTIKNYQGSLLVISHDKHFVREVGITTEIVLS